MTTRRFWTLGFMTVVVALNTSPATSQTQFSKDRYTGSERFTAEFVSPDVTYVVTLAAIRDTSSTTHYGISISAAGSHCGFYERAFDDTGNQFPFRRVTVELLDDGRCHESGGIAVSRDYLVGRQTSGLDFKLDGKRDRVVTVPASYVSEFIASTSHLD